MDKVLVSLFVLGATLVWSEENVTRTAKLEILRSPTKVAVWKPDPYPVVRSYGDDIPPPAVKNQTAAAPNNETEERIVPEGSEDSLSSRPFQGNATLQANSTEALEAEMNTTCIRRDYEDDVSAIFKGKAGAIETAELVFNSTVTSNYIFGAISNTTDLGQLKVLNDAVVDCNEYLEESPILESLGPGALASLAGGK